MDFDKKEAEQHVDWNTSDIDFEGRGADRGLRGFAFMMKTYTLRQAMNYSATTKVLNPIIHSKIDT